MVHGTFSRYSYSLPINVLTPTFIYVHSCIQARQEAARANTPIMSKRHRNQIHRQVGLLVNRADLACLPPTTHHPPIPALRHRQRQSERKLRVASLRAYCIQHAHP
jgi:hypothetical protein